MNFYIYVKDGDSFIKKPINYSHTQSVQEHVEHNSQVMRSGDVVNE